MRISRGEVSSEPAIPLEHWQCRCTILRWKDRRGTSRGGVDGVGTTDCVVGTSVAMLERTVSEDWAVACRQIQDERGGEEIRLMGDAQGKKSSSCSCERLLYLAQSAHVPAAATSVWPSLDTSPTVELGRVRMSNVLFQHRKYSW